MAEKMQFHIHASEGQVGEYCLLPGDPGRCEIIADRLDNPRFISSNREFKLYTGMLCGKAVSVCSTGIGGPSAAIAMEELANLGAHTFIRVGTCGGIALDVCAGDIVIALSAVRQEGTSREYAPEGYPATADFSVVSALADEADSLGVCRHVGVVQSKDSFYGQHEPSRMPVSDVLLSKWEAYKRLGVLCSEMEAAALYTVAASRGLRCGAVFAVFWNRDRESAGLESGENFDTSGAINTAVGAVKRLILSAR